MPRSPVEASVVGPAMGDIIGGEHRVRIAANSGGRAGAGKVAAPEKWVNCFVRVVALMERTGNALGTLAFTWATVILLGGYPTVLGSKNDYWFTTIIVFLEAARMFSSNRSDYQLFFRTRGAFRSLGGKGLIVIVCFWGATFSIIVSPAATTLLIAIIIIMVLLAVVQFLCPRGARRPQTYYKWLCTAVSLWSPVVAILLLASPIYHNRGMNGIIPRNPLAMRLVYVVLVVVVLLATVSRLQFPIIINLVQGALGSKQVQLFWHRVVRKLCMLAAVVMLLFMVDQQLKAMMIVLDICAITILSFGNLQIPAALLRVVLAFLRLLGPLPHEYKGDDDSRINLVPSLTIFYGMVLGQGILYIVAGILEVFSFIPRRSLVRNGGFTGQWGVESVKLYYAYAFDKNMEGGVFASKRISLSNFAVDSINSDLSKDQLYGIRMMHLFLQRDPTRAELQEKLTSTQTMARLISMLDWTSRNDHTTIRTYAAKVTAELAKSLRIVTVPGAMQLVSTLLDADGKPKRAHPLLVADDDQDPFVDTTERREKRPDAAGDQGQRQELVGDIDNMLATPTRSTHVNNQRSILRSCQRISEYWSIPKEQALTDDDLLPALGMSIVYNLASCDQNNCVEIDRVTDLIPKIIGFTSFRSAMVNSEAQQKVLVKTLQVLQKLTSIEGEIGITLRYKISKHPFLLRNLAEIMGDNSSTQELRKLVAEILRNLAIDRDTRQEIGHMQVLITRLIKAFLNSDRPSSANADCLLPKIAGQALAMLASENVHNCLVMLKEPEFINKLKNAIHDNKYIYVAASLLRNLCMHAQPELMESGLKELSHTLQKVLDRIMDVEGAELEILIGLSSQICKVNPEEFAQELEHGQIKRRFVKRLVDALNANMKPSVHCPGIRRVILEQSIYMMECNSHYANCFNEFQMMDALSMVEETPSRAENYMIFLGDTGFMECSTPLFVLVDRAKQLIGRQWLQGINNAS